MKNKFEANHVVYDEAANLNEWVTSNYHGIVGHRTQNNMDDFKAPVIVVYYDVDYVKNPKGTNYWRNRVLKVAQNYQQVRFAVSNAQQFAGELEEYGLTAPDASARDAAPVVGGRDKEGKKYVMTEKFSVDSFEKWVKDFVEGKLEAHVKSEELPADNSGPVKTAVGKNFQELVTDSKKDVLIEFYAPWCGHCKKLAPVWEELGDALKDEDNVAIVKMDAVANDVPLPFVVHGFPTIYFYPADTKEPKKYEGGRDVKDFVAYLAKHSSDGLQGYDKTGKKISKDEL
jgi:protein disulfide isomerase family A protein 3